MRRISVLPLSAALLCLAASARSQEVRPEIMPGRPFQAAGARHPLFVPRGARAVAPAGRAPLAAPLAIDWPAEAYREDPSNLVRRWNERPSPEAMHEQIRQSLSVPSEPARPSGGPAFLAAAADRWQQIGNGMSNADGVHHAAGRISCAAYAYDRDQGLTVLWLGSSSGGLWKAVQVFFWVVWVPVSQNLPGSPSVGAFLVHPQDSHKILIGTGDPYRYGGDGMWRTLDGGATWQRASLPGGYPFLGGGAFTRIVADRADPSGNTVLACAWNGIYRSTDFGGTWTAVYFGNTTDLRQDPAYPQYWYAGCAGVGVLESDNWGGSFHPISGTGGGLGAPGDIGRVGITVCDAAANYVYALVEKPGGTLLGIYRSDYYGYSWTAIESVDSISWGQGFHAHAISVDPGNPNRLFVGMGGMQWSSNAAGNPVAWNKTTDAGHADQTGFLFEPGTSYVIITNDGGYYVYDYFTGSLDGRGNTYGLNCAQVMEPNGTMAGSRSVPTLLLSGLQDNGMVRTDSRFSPASWLLGGGDGGKASISPDNADWMAFSSGVAYNRWLSFNGGWEWAWVNYPLGNEWTANMLVDPTPGYGNVVYTEQQLYFFGIYLGSLIHWKWFDTSSGWQRISETSTPADFYPHKLDAVNNPGIYCFYLTGWTDERLLVYEGGSLGSLTLLNRTPPLPARTRVNGALANADKSSYQPNTVYYTTSGSRPVGAYLSFDRGQTWHNVTGNLASLAPDLNFYKLVGNPLNMSQLFLATHTGLFRSDDFGKTWYRFMNGLPAVVDVVDININADTHSPPILQIGTYGRGWFERVVGPGLQDFWLDPVRVTGGCQNCTGTVTISGPAPAGGITFSVQSDNPAASVPASVTIPEGQTWATFTVSTSAVTSLTFAGIRVFDSEASKYDYFGIRPPALSGLAFSPVSGTGSCFTPRGRVTLDCAAAADTPVALTVVAGSDAVAALPASVTVPAGSSVAEFDLGTRPVAAATTVTVRASLGSDTSDASVTVVPPRVSTVTFAPAKLTGGFSTVGTVRLDCVAPASATIKLAAVLNGSAIASMPASITIPAGASSGTFSVATRKVGVVKAVDVQAKGLGSSATGRFTLRPAAPVSLTFSPNPVTGGLSTKGTVTLDVAPIVNVTVSLSRVSGGTFITSLPTSVVVAAGSKSKSFTVGTRDVSTTQQPVIGAKAYGVTVKGTLTLSP